MNVTFDLGDETRRLNVHSAHLRDAYNVRSTDLLTGYANNIYKPSELVLVLKEKSTEETMYHNPEEYVCEHVRSIRSVQFNDRVFIVEGTGYVTSAGDTQDQLVLFGAMYKRIEIALLIDARGKKTSLFCTSFSLVLNSDEDSPSALRLYFVSTDDLAKLDPDTIHQVDVSHEGYRFSVTVESAEIINCSLDIRGSVDKITSLLA